jgi:hypothetical protein
MVSKASLAAVIVLISPAASLANGTCEVPSQMSSGQKLPCVRASRILLDQPSLTIEQLTKGPDFDASAPVKSRFAYFTPDDTLTCYFRPLFAFIRDKGRSPKFLCWQLDGTRALLDRTGQPIQVDDVKVVVREDKGGELRSALFARSDAANAEEIKADQVKVKYLLPPFPNHDRRYNEVFTEVAATRILWALGFPADRMYSALAANCVGCTADPFKDNLTDNKASLRDKAVPFSVVAIERLLAWDAIDPKNDETWSWADAAALYASGWTREQKVGFDAYRLALGLLTYHNPLDSQNRLVCAEWKAGADNPKVCVQAVILVQDVGSSFGKPGSLGTNSRGDFAGWQSQTVFSSPDRCELKYPLKGDSTVLKEAQDLLLRRLENLDRERVKAIFAAARFQMVDQKQLERLRHSGAANVEDAALNEWTDVFMRHVAEVRAARNCRN